MVIPRFGLPVDPAQWIAAALGIATLVAGARLARIGRRHEGRAVVLLAVIAALLSWGYVTSYLRGGPRIIDATSYYLEARALSEGHVTWPAGDPETAVLGRFLVRSEDATGARAAVLFPPGYPLLLALGFLVGSPLAVGPLLAAALVLATFALAKEIARGSPDLEGVPLAAAAFSATCAALRYHTADTMSHGLAALCFTVALTFLLRAREGSAVGSAVVAGFFGGWLFATRPASGLAFAVTAIVILVAFDRALFVQRAKLLGGVALGMVPLLIVYLVHQRLATGRWLLSTHAAHYALNDGPAGCFRYGFGDGIGCFGEHGDFVRANLPDGFGFVAAVKTTARRLWMHLVDAGNAEPLALLVPVGAALAWKRPGVRALATATVLLIAAYVPFYFDGNYPGGGARLFADVLPFEHVLLAIAAVSLVKKKRAVDLESDLQGARQRSSVDGAPSPRLGIATLALPPVSGAWLVGLALLGFAVRAGFDHAMLRDRDGGAPAFSVEALRARGAQRGLLFVDSDAAFNLGFDPDARAATSIEVVRFKGESFDELTWTSRGAPAEAFVARFEEPPGGGRGAFAIRPYLTQATTNDPAIDAGALWPPRAQEGGAHALPVFAGGTCASAVRPLRVLTTTTGGEVHVGVPTSFASGRVVDVSLLLGPGSEAAQAAATSVQTAATTPPRSVEIALQADGATLARGAFPLPNKGIPVCLRALSVAVPAGARRVDVVVTAGWRAPADPELQPLVALDRIAAHGVGSVGSVGGVERPAPDPARVQGASRPEEP